MNELYRIKKGQIETQDLIISFDFGLIFEDQGILFFELYVVESFDLNIFIEGEVDKFLNKYFSITGETEKKNKIEATDLIIRSIRSDQTLIKMQCYGHLKHTDLKHTTTFYKENKIKDDTQTLYYIEVEGLNMLHTDLTEVTRNRNGNEIQDFNNYKRDHTSVVMLYNPPGFPGNKNILLTFYNSEENENTIIELPNKQSPGYYSLPYAEYLVFKRDFIYLLSLLNGAEIQVRKEFIGGYYNIGTINSETIVLYSDKKLVNESYNKYVPLNNGFHVGDYTLGHILMNGLNKYITENKSLDLNSIIFYMNGAQRSNSIEERFFILIIALERLSQKLVDSSNSSDLFIISETDFQPIKKDLISALNKYKSINKSAIEKLKAKVGEINIIKRTSTRYKFLKLLEYANISITPEIENIIEHVRHKSIHHGEIGDGNQAMKNYLILDELLRDIILNIIGYNRARISRYRVSEKLQIGSRKRPKI